MTEVLFIQGGGENVHDEWDNKLVASLQSALGADYHVRYPRMPREENPTYAAWKPTIEREISSLPDGSILVGHSIGGTVLINTIADLALSKTLGAIVLLSAPFIGEGGWPSDEITARDDLGGRLPADVPVLLFHGDADEEIPTAHIDLYATVIPQARVQKLGARDHQLGNDLTEVAAEIKTLRSN
jgi:predicted alpha/beta hydrolase family esterase